LKVAAAKDEKWIKSKTQYVAKGLEGNAGKEYEYYKRECSAYGVTPATTPWADQWRPAKVEVKQEIKKEKASSSSEDEDEGDVTDTDVTVDSPRSDEVPTVIPVDDNEAEEKQAASSQGGLPLTKIPETQEEPLK